MERRPFLRSATGTLLTAPSILLAQGEPPSKLRVGVIGHTGRGNYGHGLDTVWLKVEETEIVAVADADAAGLEKAKARLKIDSGFADYRAMLTETQPDIVAICPRHADQHHDMALAAIESGAKGVYIEKPFVRTPAEADSIVAACQSTGAKLAVAHRNRYHPTLKVMDELIKAGKLGNVLEIRARGKGDARGGAQDLWVLGSHCLNLVHYFGGAPTSCSAILKAEGKPVTKTDVVEGAEGLGFLAGDELHARFELESRLTAYFDSIANDGTKSAGFGLQIVGSDGILNLQCDKTILAHFSPGNPFQPTKVSRPWIPVFSDGLTDTEPNAELIHEVQHHVAAAEDLVAAIRENRQPLCSADEGALTVEMICATFESHRLGGKAVGFPLQQRENALGLL